MRKYIWMAVEADEYELPLAVADTARELAEKCNTTTHSVEISVSKQCDGSINGWKYVKVRNEND